MKRLDIGNKSFRQRRGKWVEIPEDWVNKTTDKQTIRKRDSKKTRKTRNQDHRARYREGEKWDGYWNEKYLKYKRGEDVFGDTTI